MTKCKKDTQAKKQLRTLFSCQNKQPVRCLLTESDEKMKNVWNFLSEMLDIFGMSKTSNTVFGEFAASNGVGSAFFGKLGFQKTFSILFIRIRQLCQHKNTV